MTKWLWSGVDENGVNLVCHFVEHLAPVLETRSVGEHLHHFLSVWRAHIDVTEGYDVAQSCFHEVVDIFVAAVTYSYDSKVNFVVGPIGFLLFAFSGAAGKN